MKAPRNNPVFKFRSLLIIAISIVLVALLLVPVERIKTSAQSQDRQELPQDPADFSLNDKQIASLKILYGKLLAGEPFAQEETLILHRVVSIGRITPIEADVVISRALYQRYFVKGKLSERQEALLEKYENYRRQRRADKNNLSVLLGETTAPASPAAPAVIPANDDCSGAIAITDTGSYPILQPAVGSLDIHDATTSGDPALCGLPGTDDTVWYTFVPTATATYTFSTCTTGTGSSDTVVGVFTAASCSGPFTSVACQDDAVVDCSTNSTASIVSPTLTTGVTYYIVVGRSTFAGEPGSVPIQLSISKIPVPANDMCGTATTLTLNTPVDGTTVGANDDYHLTGATCFTGLGDNSVGNTASTASGRDVAYTFVAPASNSYSFRITSYGNSLEPVMYVTTSCPSGTSPISVTCSSSTGPAIAAAHRANGTGAQEVACVPLGAGQTVYVFVDEDSLSTGSTFTIEVNPCLQETEANGTPATATIGTEGVINASGDVDFYLLGTPAAGSRVFAMVDGIAANNYDFDMRVTNTTDTLEYDSADAASQFGELSTVVAGTLLTGVDSYLRISRGSLGVASGPYRLYTKIQPGGTLLTPNCSGTKSSATAEGEPNGTPAQANSAANNYFYGDITGPAPATDVDYYSFTANAGDLIFVALDGDPCRGSAMNAALDLHDASDLPLVSVNDGDGTNCGGSCGPTLGNLAGTTPVAPAEALVYRARYTGTYYARVFTGTSAAVGVGDYLLSISLNNDHGPTAADSSISGTVTATTGGPLAGVSMVLTSGSGTNLTTTDAAGHYSFPDLETGDFFVVSPAPSNYTFAPSKRPYSLRSNVKNAHFTANPSWIDATKPDEPSGSGALNGLSHSQSTNGQSIEQSWPAALSDAARSGALKVNSESPSTQQGIAAGPAVKIQIRHSGWYRINQADLVAAGLDPAVNARMLQLYVDGEEVPILLSGDGASFKATDTLEFYGVGLNTPTTDTRTYWLISGNAPGMRISGRRNKVSSSYAPWRENLTLRSFDYTTERKEKLTYFPNLLNGDLENIFGPLVMADPAMQHLTVRNFETQATAQPELEIALQGITPLNHQVEVKLNGNNVGTIGFDARAHSVTKLTVDRSLLSDGDNVVSLAAAGGASDISFVDWIRLTYARQYVAENNALQFSVPGGKAVRVQGFTTPNVRVFDITDPRAVTEIDRTLTSDGAGYSLRVHAKGTETRSLLALADDLADSPAGVTANLPSNWKSAVNSAAMVIITHKDFRQPIEPLAALRRSQGLSVAVVDVEDVFDEFSYGAHTPAALKDFLSWAAGHWTSAPQYLLLVGDSSWDPRNYFGEGDNDFVPTKLIDTFYMETASDDWLADFNGTGMPDMAVGRLPARTVADVNLMVSKILAYEQERESGAALRGAVLVADIGFESENNQTRALLPADVSVQTISRAVIANDVLARSQILDALNQGPMLVNYYGHGSVEQWTAGLLENDLASGLTNTNRPSLFVMMTCLNGYAHDAYIDSLGEAALKAADGGAMAVWASSGLTEPGPQFAMSSEFYRQAFGIQALRLGKAIQKAKAATIDNDVRRTWMLLGDPAMRLQ